MDTIGLKIKSKNQIPACIKILRKYIELSIGEVKDAISNGDFVFECSYIDEDGINKILNIYRDLIEINVEMELFEHGRLTNITFLENLSNTYRDIDNDVDRMMDEEIG